MGMKNERQIGETFLKKEERNMPNFCTGFPGWKERKLMEKVQRKMKKEDVVNFHSPPILAILYKSVGATTFLLSLNFWKDKNLHLILIPPRLKRKLYSSIAYFIMRIYWNYLKHLTVLSRSPCPRITYHLCRKEHLLHLLQPTWFDVSWIKQIRKLSSWIFSISTHRDYEISLSNLFWCLTTLKSRLFSLVLSEISWGLNYAH